MKVRRFERHELGFVVVRDEPVGMWLPTPAPAAEATSLFEYVASMQMVNHGAGPGKPAVDPDLVPVERRRYHRDYRLQLLYDYDPIRLDEDDFEERVALIDETLNDLTALPEVAEPSS